MRYKQILNPVDRIYNLPFSASAAAGAGGKEDPTKWEFFHIKNEYAGDNVLTINLSRTYFTRANTEYSLDKETWEPLSFGDNTYITMPEGSTVYLRGTDWVRDMYDMPLPAFTCTENFSVGGCILSLLDYTNMKNITEIPEGFAQYMFADDQLIQADFNIGNATSVGINGFSGCFEICTNLTTAPDFSHVTSVDNGGFQNCFNMCTNLTTAPDFSHVTSVDTCGFCRCFAECSNLNYVYAPSVSEWDVDYFENWLEGVSSEGTMSCPQGVEILEGESGIPEGWTRVDR